MIVSVCLLVSSLAFLTLVTRYQAELNIARFLVGVGVVSFTFPLAMSGLGSLYSDVVLKTVDPAAHVRLAFHVPRVPSLMPRLISRSRM